MNIQDIIIGLAVFSAFSLAGGLFAMSIMDEHNTAAKSSIRTFNYTEKISNEYSKNIQDKLTGREFGLVQAAEVILTGGWTALLSIITLPGLVGMIAYDATGAVGLPIPAWFVGLIILIISIIVIFKITAVATKSTSGDGI
jgi:hypothetical protein